MTSGLRSALEVALAANPDDLAAHMAYGDYLAEQGDPRGELVQVQLALEDPSRSASQRKSLQKREKELLARHLPTWMGPAHVLFGREGGWERQPDAPFGLDY